MAVRRGLYVMLVVLGIFAAGAYIEARGAHDEARLAKEEATDAKKDREELIRQVGVLLDAIDRDARTSGAERAELLKRAQALERLVARLIAAGDNDPEVKDAFDDFEEEIGSPAPRPTSSSSKPSPKPSSKPSPKPPTSPSPSPSPTRPGVVPIPCQTVLDVVICPPRRSVDRSARRS